MACGDMSCHKLSDTKILMFLFSIAQSSLDTFPVTSP